MKLLDSISPQLKSSCYVHHCNGLSGLSLLPLKPQKCKLKRSTVLCSKDSNISLGNVADALQRFGDRLTKTEQFNRLKEYLKQDGNLERLQVFLSNRNAVLDDTDHLSVKKNTNNGEEKRQTYVKLDFPFVSDRTIEASTPRGNLSVAAISCIEQFSRLCGITGNQMKKSFYSQTPATVNSEARYLVEYCCFRYLCRHNTDFHPSLKEAAFRRLIFITMLAWQQPYENGPINNKVVHENDKIAREDAFSRIAPAVAGVADKVTVHHLYKALTEGGEGLSFGVWDTYLSELVRVHDERQKHGIDDGSSLSLDVNESVLCVGASKRQPVQMWNKNNVAWPGRLTLTERALYFEPNGIIHHQKPMKLELQGGHGSIQRLKIGPVGMPIFDSAVAVTADDKSEPWVLDFVDFSGGMRREVWFVFIDEILSVYSFISEYAPSMNDPGIRHGYGSQHGYKKAVASAVNGIARVQAVQSTLGRLLENPGRLLQFSYLKGAPGGDLVKQSLALIFWGGHFANNRKLLENAPSSSTNSVSSSISAVDTDGSVYLQRWMKSPSWKNPESSNFWKNKAGGKGLTLGKELVVGDATYLDKAVKLSLDQSQMLEKTRATIDGALVKGIPSNIDLFKELMLPFTVLSIATRRLQKWESPPSTITFLAVSFFIIYKDWVRFLLPAFLMASAVVVLVLHNTNFERRIDNKFGAVTIREQPPSNTLQKIMALKEALAEVEVQIQKMNIVFLKLRSLVLAGHPQGKSIVAIGLLGISLILLLVPFRYICAFFLLDQFTCELEFRRGTVLKWYRQLNEWWNAIPAVPVIVLPYEGGESKNILPNADDLASSTKTDAVAEAVKEWFAESF